MMVQGSGSGSGFRDYGLGFSDMFHAQAST